MEVTRETEEEQEIEYTWDDNSDPDISYGKSDGNKKQCLMTIHMFGMTADGVSLRCDVDGFRPYLYVKVPPSLDIIQFKQHLGPLAPASMSVERVKRKELYGFTADEEFTFFKLAVASIKDFRALKNIFLNDHQEPIFSLSKKSSPLPVYESGLDPLLRFFHLRDVAPCGWVSVDPTEDGFDDETGIRVIKCSWEDVSCDK
jgi:DNA polymerase elongation subunit (family B)